MYYEVYVDVLFVENLWVNVCLLLLTSRLMGYQTDRKRIAAGAALGSMGACLLETGSAYLTTAGWFLGESMAETVMGLAAVMIISLILQLILLPAVYWLGEMKARIVFLAFVLASVFLITALSSGSRIPVTEETVMTGLVAGLFFAAALLVPSYLLSAAAMERKDF